MNNVPSPVGSPPRYAYFADHSSTTYMYHTITHCHYTAFIPMISNRVNFIKISRETKGTFNSLPR